MYDEVIFVTILMKSTLHVDLDLKMKNDLSWEVFSVYIDSIPINLHFLNQKNVQFLQLLLLVGRVHLWTFNANRNYRDPNTVCPRQVFLWVCDCDVTAFLFVGRDLPCVVLVLFGGDGSAKAQTRRTLRPSFDVILMEHHWGSWRKAE